MKDEKGTFYAKKLKLLRVTHFFSQQEMANKFKISQQGYAKLENGKINFSIKRIEKICKVFNISFDEFITISHKPKKVKSKSTDSYNIKVLKLYYEKLLLEKEIQIGDLELQIKHLSKGKKTIKSSPKLRVIA